MAHFSFFLALSVVLSVNIHSDQPITEMPQLIEEYFMDSLHMPQIYPNNLKNWEFDKEAPQNFCLERMTIAERQGMSEDKDFEVRPMPSKTNFSSCLGINELNDKCKSVLLQKLFQQRMETALPEGSESLQLFAQIESLKAEGFSDDEFKKAKEQMLSQMDNFSSKTQSARAIFSEADAVTSACKHCVEKMQLSDLSSHLAAFLSEDPNALRLLYPEPVQSGWVFERAGDMSVRFADNPITDGPLFFINTPSGHIEPFYQLPLNEKDQKLIHELIKTVAEKNVWGLLFKKKEVERLGRRVNHVHPMRFMGHILADNKLHKWLKDIRHSTFKWDHFIDGFSDRMKEEEAKNNLVHYVPGMAHLLHADPDQIMSYIENRDYLGLVKSLL